MQSIEATLVPATSTKPQRIKVSTAIGSRVYPFPKLMNNLADGYVQVVCEHVKSLGWNAQTMYYGGNVKGNGYNFVIVTDYSKVEL